MGRAAHFMVLRVAKTRDTARFKLHGFVDPDTGYTNHHLLQSVNPVTVPSTAVLKMNADPNLPGGDWVTPVLLCSNVWAVNAEMKELFESLGDDLEFLPVRAVDKNERELAGPYFLFRPLTEVDCIDKEESAITWDDERADFISEIEKLVLVERVLPEKKAFFRIKALRELVVHESVVAALAELRLQPFEYIAVSDFTFDGVAAPLENRTEFDPPAKRPAAKKAAAPKLPSFPEALERWSGKAVEVTLGSSPSKSGLVFRWTGIDERQRALLVEQLGPAAQELVRQGSLVPFAVLGTTEESGESLTLENLLDVQHDGVLLFDAKRGVHHDDEGTLSSTGEDVATMRVTAKT